MEPALILLSSRKPLAAAVAEACARRGARLVRAATVEECAAAWGEGEARALGVLADSRSLRERERARLVEVHHEGGAPGLLFLEPGESTYPAPGPRAVPRLQWSMDPDFLARAALPADAPAVFLADETLYLTGLLHELLREAGWRAVVADSAAGLEQILETAWEWTVSGTLAGRAVVLRWSGGPDEVRGAVRGLAEKAPAAVLRVVESRAPLLAAAEALGRRWPAFLPRRLLEPGLDLLLGRPAEDPTSLGRVLVLDDDAESLAAISRDLMEEGYEITACAQAQDALDAAEARHYHAAVLGADARTAEGAASVLAARLRALDPELSLILLLEEGGAEESFTAIGRAVEGRLDGCLLKPADRTRARLAVARAIDRRRLEAENGRMLARLQETHQSLERLASFQKNFFAMVAHDIKNPLMGVSGFAELLELKLADPKLLDYARHIQSSARALTALVNDLVDLAAIESGKLRVERVRAEPARIAEEVAARVRVAAEARRIAFALALASGLPELRCDPLRLGQVLQNLCTNAIQYTPEGGTVELSARGESGAVVFAVRDSGIGIAKKDLARIFERFFQAEDAQAMRGGGFGLGLVIASEIVAAHGGTIAVDSEPGKGSTFRVAIPIPT